MHVGKGSDYITAIEALGTPAVGSPATFRNASTAADRRDERGAVPSTAVNRGQPGQCTTKTTKVQLMNVKGWKVGGEATCCAGENQITRTFTQPGNVKIALTVSRRETPSGPAKEETVTQTFQVAALSCDPISVRGVTVKADGCWKVTTATDGTKAYETTPTLTVGGLRVLGTPTTS